MWGKSPVIPRIFRKKIPQKHQKLNLCGKKAQISKKNFENSPPNQHYSHFCGEKSMKHGVAKQPVVSSRDDC